MGGKVIGGGAWSRVCYHRQMRETSIRGSRQAIGAGLAAAMVLAGIGFLWGRSTAPAQKSPAVEPTQTPSPAPKPIPSPVPPRTLGRAELIDLAGLAADAQASGTQMPPVVVDAAGQSFELVLSFGCSGPSTAASGGSMGWEANPETGVHRIRAKPKTWSANEWGLQAQGTSLVGFWIDRPWAYEESCAAHTAPAKPEQVSSSTTPPEQTLAIAQFGRADTRTAQRGFEKVERIGPDDWDTSAGLWLRLTGKLGQGALGSPVRCIQPEGPDQRPKCIIVVRFEEARIENAATGRVLGVWDERSLQR